MLGSSWHASPRGRGSVSGDPGGGAISVHTTYNIHTPYKSKVWRLTNIYSGPISTMGDSTYIKSGQVKLHLKWVV